MKKNYLYLNIMHVLNDGFLAVAVIMLPFLVEVGKISVFQAGILDSVGRFAGMVFIIPVVKLAEKIGGMKTMVIGVLFYSVLFIGYAFELDFIMLFLMIIVAGISFGTFHPIAFSTIARLFEKGKRGTPIGNFTAVGDIGRILLAGVVSFLISKIGFSATNYIYFFVGILVFVILFFTIKNDTKEKIKEEKPKERTRYIQIIKDKETLLLIGANIFDALASTSLFVFLPFLLIDKNVDTAFLSQFAAVFLIGNLLGKAILGRLIDKYNGLKIFIAAEIIMGLLIISLVHSNALIIVAFVSLLLGIVTKGTIPILMTIISDASDKHKEFEKSFAVISQGIQIGGINASVILGLLTQNYGSGTAFYFAAVMAVLSAIVGLIYSNFVNRQLVLNENEIKKLDGVYE